MEFTEAQLLRYARHIVLPEVGGIGQERLLQSSVLVVGAGGLGAPSVLYLAAAGVGTIGLIDDDVVDLSNLQRQIIHSTERIGVSKVDSAKVAVAEVNPDVALHPYCERLTQSNVMALIGDYDVVVDGSDNFDTRYLLNDACHFAKKTLVSAAIHRFEGQLATYKSGADPNLPCYRCLYPDPPPPGLIPTCAEGGVLGALAGVLGSLQAIEVIKEIVEIGDSLAGSLLIYDALATIFRKVTLKPAQDCVLCGDTPTILACPGQ